MPTRVRFLQHLEALDVLTVPERLGKAIGESKEEHVVHGPLAEIMINSENSPFVEGLKQNLIELPR
jgi:hypothetical protein